ncbi:MAG: cell wall-binding repeat-containing protein [Actinomycetota bacterium]|nr:cell wall-binding repeat-containing protein [Actinomycetota bacterium]
MRTRFLILILILFMVLACFPHISNAASYEETFFIAPIVGNCTYENLMDMKGRLGIGGYYAKIGFTASLFYMSETKGRAQDFEFDPTNLNNILNLAKETNLPVVIVFNGGPWGGTVRRDPSVNAIVYLEQNPMNCQWKDDGTVPRDEMGTIPGLGRLLTYNNLNTEIRRYQERNFKAAATIIAQFYRERPDLLIGVNTDAEIFMSPFYYTDYNPDTIREFREFEKAKFGGDLSAFNRAMETSFKSWEEVGPPRPAFGEPIAGNPRAEEWTNFRIRLVDIQVQREVDWFREVGLPASRIYTHQTVRTDNPFWSRYFLASPLETASVDGGCIGITTLQNTCFDENLFATARAWSPNWGIFEHNPSIGQPQHNPYSASYNWGDHYLRCFRALQVAYRHGAHILSPYYWEKEQNEPYYTIKGTAFETAIRDFIKSVGSHTRPLWGQTSHGTAVAISQAGWSSSRVVLVARDDYFTDALPGVPLAYTFKNDPMVNTPIPILLTNPETLSSESLAEIKRLGTKIAIVLGGPGAISENVLNQLRANGITPDRIWQNTSYGTAADVARRIFINSVNFGIVPPTTAIITTGENFPDALAVSSPAAANNMPILLTKPTLIPSETLQVLQDLGIRNLIIVGGPGAVHPDVEQYLRNSGYNILTRLWGADQYETAVKIAIDENSLFRFTSPGPIFVTRGDFFADGLAGGALAARMNPAPILLVEPGMVPDVTRSFVSHNKSNISTIYVLGGPGAVSEDVKEQLNRL